jgi:hypothetical protein
MNSNVLSVTNEAEIAQLNYESIEAKLKMAAFMKEQLRILRARTDRSMHYGRKTGTGFGGCTKSTRFTRKQKAA